eukprot:jgi/Galph1/5168/GphlegSOOS_G3877.1
MQNDTNTVASWLGPQTVLRGHSSEVSALQFLESDQWLVSGDANGQVILWETNSKRLCWTDKDIHHTTCIVEIHYASNHSDTFYSQDKQGLFVEWKVIPSDVIPFSSNYKHTVLQSIPVGFTGISRSDLSHGLLAVAQAMPKESLAVYDVARSSANPLVMHINLSTESGHCGICTRVSFLTEELLMTLHEDGSLKVSLWSLKQQQLVQHLQITHLTLLSCYHSLATDASTNSKVFVGGVDRWLRSFQFDGSLIHEDCHWKLKTNGLSDISVRSDGRIMAVAHWDSKARLYDCRKSFRQLATLPHENFR